jgi:hypothetical protein
MIATLGKLPSTLATTSLGASRRLMACTSSLPLGKDPSFSPKSSTRQHIVSSGATGKECPTLGTWSIYDDSIRRIVLKFQLCISFPCTFFRLNKYYFKRSSAMCRALPSPPSCLKPSPSTCSGALLKPTHGLQNLGVTSLSYSSPSTRSGAWLKANLRVIRPEDTIPNEYEASCRREHAWSRRSPDLSPRLLPARRPNVSLHAELWRSVSQPLHE